MGNVPSDIRDAPDLGSDLWDFDAHSEQHYCGDGSAAEGGIPPSSDVRPDNDNNCGTTNHVSMASTVKPSTVAAALHSVDELFQDLSVPKLSSAVSEQQQGSKILLLETQPNPAECETAATAGMSSAAGVGAPTTMYHPAKQPNEHQTAQSAGSTAAAGDEGGSILSRAAKRKASTMQTTTTAAAAPGHSDHASVTVNAASARQDGRRKRPANDNNQAGRLPAGGSSSAGATLLRQWLAAGGWAAPAFLQARSHTQGLSAVQTHLTKHADVPLACMLLALAPS